MPDTIGNGDIMCHLSGVGAAGPAESVVRPGNDDEQAPLNETGPGT